MQTKLSRITGQLTSGRWLMTVAAAACLVKLTWTICWLLANGKITLETATYVAICMAILNNIGLVAVFYFNKRAEETNGNGNGNANLMSAGVKPLDSQQP